MGTTATIDGATVQTIVERILAAARPRRIILFGSAAAGRMTPDSDVDLLVVEDAPDNTRAESARLRQALGELGFPIDVLVIAADRFEETKDLVGSIAYPAHHYGKVIYEAA
jgi:predicted nucleotidyltransferase